MTDYDIGRLTSGPLTEVRTVLSRAQTALAMLEDAYGVYAKLEVEPAVRHEEPYGDRVYGRFDTTGYQPRRIITDKPAVVIPHPDLDEMRDALRTTINMLRRWERTGAKRRKK
jgi:hypothetical protein